MPFDNPGAEVELNDVTLKLIEGRQRIERGWCQERYKLNDSYCALGAIGVDEMRTEELQSSCVSYLHKFLPSFIRSDASPEAEPETLIIFYNDEPNRTHSEIIDLFDRAIADSMNCG